MASSQNDTYKANGTEGTTLTRTILIGYTILLCFQGSFPLKQVTTTPNVGEFKFDSTTGILTFGASLELNQIIQTIYK